MACLTALCNVSSSMSLERAEFKLRSLLLYNTFMAWVPRGDSARTSVTQREISKAISYPSLLFFPSRKSSNKRCYVTLLLHGKVGHFYPAIPLLAKSGKALSVEVHFLPLEHTLSTHAPLLWFAWVKSRRGQMLFTRLWDMKRTRPKVMDFICKKAIMLLSAFCQLAASNYDQDVPLFQHTTAGYSYPFKGIWGMGW